MNDGVRLPETLSRSVKSNFSFLLSRWLEALPPAYAGITLATCLDLPIESRQYGVRWATSLPTLSLYLYGPYGAGKTTYAIALIREYLRHWTMSRYAWATWTSGRQLDIRLLEAIRGDGDRWLIERFSNEELLYIDDVDKVSPTERYKSQFFEIINHRLMNLLPTILTSNCEPREMAHLFGGAVLSRIQDKSTWQIVRFPDRDLRQMRGRLEMDR